MKNTLLLLAFVLNVTCFGQEFDWALSMGSTNNDVGNSITIDNAGNSYTTGYFIGTVDFDPSANTVNLTSPSSGMPSAFIAKYDINGALVWAKNLSGNQWVYGENIDIDAAGNLYVTGYFGGTADFDPSASTANLGVAGESDIFFAKYDNNGNYLWANRIGGSEDDRGKDIHHDGNGNIFITGGVTGTVDFDPSSGVFNLSHSLSKDIYLAKYDDDGNFLWVNAFGSPTTSFEEGLAVDTDPAGNPYLSAYYFGTVDFDPSANTANLGQVNGDETVIAKYDVNGNYLWANMIGKGMQERGNSIKVDASGNVYIVGNFAGTVDFDPSANNVNLTSEGNNDIFIAKYDNNGNYSWAKHFGGNSADYGRGIDVDANGNVYLVGSFQETVIFDDVIQYALTVSGFADYFVAKYTNNGDFIWVNRIGDTGFEEGMDVIVDVNENIYVTGQFWNTVDFDPSSGETDLTSNGSNDIFIQRFNFAPCATYYSTQEEFSCGAFTWIDNNTYTSSTTVDYTMQSVSGCDSIITLDLTVSAPLNFTDVQSSCGDFTWIDGNTYTSSNNTASMTYQAANGCDSIITLDLSIVETFPSGATASLVNSTVCQGDSTTITLSSTGVGMDYYLRDDLNNAIVDGPYPGTGNSLDLNTGAMNAGKTFNVYAEENSTPVLYSLDLPESTADYISFDNVYETFGSEITIESWVYSDGAEMPWAGQSIPFLDNNITSNVWFWTADRFYVNHLGTWISVIMPQLSAGWTHVATVADANGLYVYYDGVLVNTLPSGPNFGIRQPTGSIITLGIDPRFGPNDISRNSDTRFADFRVWNVARNQSEVSQNMNACLSGQESGLVQHTPMNEGTGSTASSNVGPDGTISPLAVWESRDVGCGASSVCSDEYGIDFTVSVAFPTSSSIMETACNGYTWPQNNETYYISGNYNDTLVNAAGCDSIVTLSLTINFTPGTGVSVNGNTLQANENGFYSWLDCNNGYAAIPGETSFSFTPNQTGDYALEITSLDGCTDTSNCVTVEILNVEENNRVDEIQLYPNPTTQYLQTNFDNKLVYRIIDITGKVVTFGVLDPNDFINVSQFERGVYFIDLESSGQTVKKKFIIK